VDKRMRMNDDDAVMMVSDRQLYETAIEVNTFIFIVDRRFYFTSSPLHCICSWFLCPLSA
jgi:hypothetical protein